MQVDPNIPVFGFIGRLEEQKGVDILIDALPKVAAAGGAQIVILGTGKKSMEASVLKLDKTYPDSVKGVVKFDVPLAHLIIAGTSPITAAMSSFSFKSPIPTSKYSICSPSSK